MHELITSVSNSVFNERYRVKAKCVCVELACTCTRIYDASEDVRFDMHILVNSNWRANSNSYNIKFISQHPSINVYMSVTICSQPDDEAKSRTVLSCKFVVEYPSHSSWWAFMSSINKKVAFLSTDCTDSGTRRIHKNYDCYYKSQKLWLHNIQTHNYAIYMPKLHHARIQPTLETDQPHPWVAASVSQNLKP